MAVTAVLKKETAKKKMITGLKADLRKEEKGCREHSAPTSFDEASESLSAGLEETLESFSIG